MKKFILKIIEVLTTIASYELGKYVANLWR